MAEVNKKVEEKATEERKPARPRQPKRVAKEDSSKGGK